MTDTDDPAEIERLARDAIVGRREMARFLGCSTSTVTNLINKGHLHVHRLGGQLFTTRSHLERLKAQLTGKR